jgi:UDP-N-acetylglucosamine acyltransferase
MAGKGIIHPTAVIHPKAELDPSVKVGPYSVIDEGVRVGAHCIIDPHVHLTGLTVIGEHNRFHAGCVIGDAPQDLKYKGAHTKVRIGDRNIFREQATVHRSNNEEEETVIGSDNYFMVNSHVGHNAVVGNHVIIANGALLSGHVSVGDRALISGNCLLHQFVRVGTLAMMQGGSAVSKDLPPYTMARGYNGICGLNIIGLRRAGFKEDERLELKKVYRLLFRSGKNPGTALLAAMKEFRGAGSRTLLDFVASSERGVCADVGRAGGEEDEDWEDEPSWRI